MDIWESQIILKQIFQHYRALAPDSKVASWLGNRLAEDSAKLHAIVPVGFESYARILNPAWKLKEESSLTGKDFEFLFNNDELKSEELIRIRWSDVAVQCGQLLNKDTEWYDLIHPTTEDKLREDFWILPPHEGEFDLLVGEEIFGFLINRYGKKQKVTCGFWDGNAHRYYRIQQSAVFGRKSDNGVYHLFNSTIGGVHASLLEAHEWSSMNNGFGTEGLVPNLIWSSNQEWFLAMDYNLRSTYIGTAKDIVRALTESIILEAFMVSSGHEIA